MDAPQLERELRELAAAAQRLVDELQRIARIADDAERGRELTRFLQSSPVMLSVPRRK